MNNPILGYLESPFGRFAWRAPDPPGWKPPPRPVVPPPRELTVEEQAYEDVKEYFKWLGKPIPPEEVKWCEEAIRLEAEAAAAARNAPPVEYVPEPSAPVRPEYGTPEYWKWWWKTKPEREAKKKAEEDAKAAKAAEREAKKKAELQEKQQKLAEKEAKRKAKEEAAAAKEQAKAAKAAAKTAKQK